MGDKLIIPGKDNYGNDRIWLSAYADSNPRSDYHWQADACYDEARRRGKPELYQQAWDAVKEELG